MTEADAVIPFAPRADQAALDDLRRRLLSTRWTDAPAGLGWSAGVDVDELRRLVAAEARGMLAASGRSASPKKAPG